MRNAVLQGVGVLCVLGITFASVPVYADHPPSAGLRGVLPEEGLLYKPRPIVVQVAEFAGNYDEVTVSDVELADFDGDGRLDVAIAWYATDLDDHLNNVRKLTIFYTEGVGLVRGPDFDLYIPDTFNPNASVFYIGTADIGVGDFDGDDDLDLAVLAYFGDEIWFIENRGSGAYTQHLRFPFGFNSDANPLTPPEALSADFDQDGRDELVYVADPSLHILGRYIHFWRTSGSIANIQRVDWRAGTGEMGIWFIRGLAVGDFNGDGRPDLCFSGAQNPPPSEVGPILAFWCNLNTSTRRFEVHNFFPSMLCSDVVDVSCGASARDSVILTELNGTRVQHWACTGGGMLYQPVAEESGYAGSPDRGMAAVIADVNGDGEDDLITKLRVADPIEGRQIELTRRLECDEWERVGNSPLDTTGFESGVPGTHLRPRNLAVGDLFGNTRPEIVGGFAARELPPTKGGGGDLVLEIAVWENSCLGDVTADGATDYEDLDELEFSLGECVGYDPDYEARGPHAGPGPIYNPNADLDKDGCVTTYDRYYLMQDIGCTCWEKARVPGDCNCDGSVDFGDINAFVRALAGEHSYYLGYPNCNWLNGDMNCDDVVNAGDINLFVELIGTWR